MSGIYKPLIIFFGISSAILCVWIVEKLGLLKPLDGLKDLRIAKTARYLFWLLVEVGKADWAVTKVILSKEIPNEQSLIDVPANQQDEIAKVLFANSITLTPGTITVETEPGHYIVHALNEEAADLKALADMGARVCALEKASARD